MSPLLPRLPPVISGELTFWGCRDALRPAPAFPYHPSSNWGSRCSQAAAGPRSSHRLCPGLLPMQPSAWGSVTSRGPWKSAVVCQQCLLTSACGSQWGGGHRPCTCPPPRRLPVYRSVRRVLREEDTCPGSVGVAEARPVPTLGKPAIALLLHFVDEQLRPVGVRPRARGSKTTRPGL